MRLLRSSTCLSSLLLLPLFPVHAQIVIDAERTTPISTATADGGQPDDIRISSKGSIELKSGIAVTVNSDHDVRNEGAIEIEDGAAAQGIVVEAGRTSSIVNRGKIVIDESYTPTDTDKDGDLDGPFAKGRARFGIRTLGVMTGTVDNSGTIDIEGNESAAIFLSGPLTGSLSHSGGIEVVGDRSFGIRTDAVSGDVDIRGSIDMRGEDSTAISITGPVGGAMLVQGKIISSGYRSRTAPDDTSKLDADDLLQGGPAIAISGDIAGGLLFDIRPRDTDPDDKDEDDDGIEDAREGNASVISYGAAPAVQIGSTSNRVRIGPIEESADGFGIVLNGEVIGSGVYSSVTGTGFLIGGLGGETEIAGGMMVNGSLTAKSLDSNADALRVGDRAMVPELRNAGEIIATGGKKKDSLVSALRIDAGGSLEQINNSGKIIAEANKEGMAAAIIDRSGTLRAVTNSGSIIADSEEGDAIALDLSRRVDGVTLDQFASADGDAPEIEGRILLGSGNDRVRFAAGSVYGDLDLGGGLDQLILSGEAQYRGALTGASEAVLSVTDARLTLTNLGNVGVQALNVGENGIIGVSIDGSTDRVTQLRIAEEASFAKGSKLDINLLSVSESEGRYQVLSADRLIGADNLSAEGIVEPYMFKSSIESDLQAGDIWVNISRKTASEMNLTRSQTRAYNAVFAVLDLDRNVAATFLDAKDAESFDAVMQQMLPDHAGGVFATVSQGSRSISRFLTDPAAPYSDQGGWGFWLQQTVWDMSKDRGQTEAFEITGLGSVAGVEIETGGLGNFGLSVGYLTSNDSDADAANEVDSDQIEFALYWRGNWGGLSAFARGSYATIDFDGKRRFRAEDNGTVVERMAYADWSGDLYSAAGGLSYEFGLGQRLVLRPSLSLDYYSLSESGYTERDGGDAFNLTVDERDSDELALNAMFAAGLNLGDTDPDGLWVRLEAEGGRREIVGGELGTTTARFKDGDPFTLDPDSRTDGWLGGLRLIGGSENLIMAGEVSAEEQHDDVVIGARLSLRVGF